MDIMQICLLLVVAVVACLGEGKPLKKSDPGPNGYVILTRDEANLARLISPLLQLQVDILRRQIRRLSKRTGVPCRMVIDSNPDRIPRDIPVARCPRSKRTCDNGSGVTGYVYAPWPVIWIVRVDGELQYRAQQQQVPVACVCMRPRTTRPG
ncbi:Hypp7677 [Branchiostoma lanceolatum]|uniref:Hypp7677 protein n=1 Tax=Branchiostoma lanceolatum TaxID=7740 RepID=A0A8J9Z2W7_BRALA|nr:Hypp7677 [Branchiostoma lanceolatum]